MRRVLTYYWLILQMSWLKMQLIGLRIVRFHLLWQMYGIRVAFALYRRRRVQGHSMEPALREGDFIAVGKVGPGLPPKRGDILVFRAPNDGLVSLKRVCGLPGETVSLTNEGLIVDGELTPEPYVSHSFRPQGRYDDQTWTLGPDELIVLGDNRFDSLDSREYGPIRQDVVIGRAWYRYSFDGRTGSLGK